MRRLSFKLILICLVISLVSCSKDGNNSSQAKKVDQITPNSKIDFDNFNLDLKDFGKKIVLVDSVFSDPNLQSDIYSATGKFITEINNYKDSLNGKRYIANIKTFGNQLRVASFGIYKDNKLIKSFVDTECTCDPPFSGSGFSCPQGYSLVGTCHSESCVKDKVATYLSDNLQESGDTAGVIAHRGIFTVTICGN